MIAVPDMIAVPVEMPPVNLTGNPRGDAQSVRNAADRGDIPISQQDANHHWMNKHNKDVAERMLRDPALDHPERV
jgi:hypothetical protein